MTKVEGLQMGEKAKMPNSKEDRFVDFSLMAKGVAVASCLILNTGVFADPGEPEPHQRRPSHGIDRGLIIEEVKPVTYLGVEFEVGIAQKSGNGKPDSKPDTGIHVTKAEVWFNYSVADNFKVLLRPNLLNVNKTPINHDTNTPVTTMDPVTRMADGARVFDDAWAQYIFSSALAVKAGITQAYDNGFAEYTGYSNITDMNSPYPTLVELSGKVSSFQYGVQTWEAAPTDQTKADQDNGIGTNMAVKLAYDKDGINAGVIYLKQQGFNSPSDFTKKDRVGGELWGSYTSKAFETHAAFFQQAINKDEVGNESILLGGSLMAFDPFVPHLDIQEFVVPYAKGSAKLGSQGTIDFVADYKLNANLISYLELQSVGKDRDNQDSGEAIYTTAVGVRTRF